MSAPGRILTRDELLDRLYPEGETVVIDRVVDVHRQGRENETDPSARGILTVRRGAGSPSGRSRTRESLMKRHLILKPWPSTRW
jgi:hypothetical protein